MKRTLVLLSIVALSVGVWAQTYLESTIIQMILNPANARKIFGKGEYWDCNSTEACNNVAKSSINVHSSHRNVRDFLGLRAYAYMERDNRSGIDVNWNGTKQFVRMSSVERTVKLAFAQPQFLNLAFNTYAPLYCQAMKRHSQKNPLFLPSLLSEIQKQKEDLEYMGIEIPKIGAEKFWQFNYLDRRDTWSRLETWSQVYREFPYSLAVKVWREAFLHYKAGSESKNNAPYGTDNYFFTNFKNSLIEIIKLKDEHAKILGLPPMTEQYPGDGFVFLKKVTDITGFNGFVFRRCMDHPKQCAPMLRKWIQLHDRFATMLKTTCG